MNIFVSQAQKNSDGIFEVKFFKITQNDFKNRSLIKIDSIGNIYNFNKPTGEKIDLKSFNKSINKFIKSESEVTKILGSNNQSDLTIINKTGKCTFEITITFLKEYRAEIDKKTITHYSWNNVSEENNKELFFKYLSKENKEILDKYLK